MKIDEAKKLLGSVGIKLIKEWGTFDAGISSPIRYDPGDCGDNYGPYRVKVNLIPSAELKELSERIFGDDDILTEVLQNFDFPEWVKLIFDERNDTISDIEWYDSEAESWFEDISEEDLLDFIEDECKYSGIQYNEKDVKKAIPMIRRALQEAADKCCDEKYLSKEWRDWVWLDD